MPVLTPYLSSLWLGLVTPVFARIGRKLIESIRHPTIVRDPAALTEFSIQPVGVRQAIADALRNEDRTDGGIGTGAPEAAAAEAYGHAHEARIIRIAYRLHVSLDRRGLRDPVPVPRRSSISSSSSRMNSPTSLNER